MANEILKGMEIVERDEGWKIPSSDPPAFIWTVHLEKDGDRQMWKTMDSKLVKGYKGDIKVYSAKSSGKTYIRSLETATEAKETEQAKVTYQAKNGRDITLGMVWKTIIGIQGIPEDDEQFAKFFETVNAHLEELILMSEKMNETT